MADLMATRGRDEAPPSSASGSLDAAKDVLAAVKSGDARALDLALQRHYETCENDEASEDEDMGG